MNTIANFSRRLGIAIIVGGPMLTMATLLLLRLHVNSCPRSTAAERDLLRPERLSPTTNAAANVVKPQNCWKSYTKSTLHFSFKYPQDWSLNEFPAAIGHKKQLLAAEFVVSSSAALRHGFEKGNGTPMRVIYRVWDNRDGKPLRTVLDEQERLLSYHKPDSSLTREVNGHAWTIRRYKNISGSLQITQYSQLADNFVYQFSLDPSDPDIEKPFHRVISSFSVW